MKAIVKVAKAAFPDWNKKAHVEDDLLEHVRRRKILLVESETDSLGEYTLCDYSPRINSGAFKA